MSLVRASGLALILLLCLSSISFAYKNLDPLAIPTKIQTEVSMPSPQIYGTAALFTCFYTGTAGEEIPNSDCVVIIDGRRNTASRGTIQHSYGEIVPAGQHSWYCSCSAKGYEAKESAPVLHVVLPAQDSDELRNRAADAVSQAEERLAQAKDRGEDTVSAEKTLTEAKNALVQGDFRLANTLIDSQELLSGGSSSQDRITDLGILLLPLLFIGVVVVAMLFIFMRK